MRAFTHGLAWGAGFLLALVAFGAWDENRAHKKRQAAPRPVSWDTRNPWDAA